MMPWPLVVTLMIASAGLGTFGGVCLCISAETSRRRELARYETVTLDAGNAAETLRMVAWMEKNAPSALAGWRENYAEWKRRKAS